MHNAATNAKTIGSTTLPELRFDLTADDLRAASKYARTHHPDGRRKVSPWRGTRALLMLVAAWAVAYFVMYREGAIRLQQPVEPAAQWTLEQFLPVIVAAGLIAALVFGFFTTASNAFKQLAADPRLKNRRFILKADGYTASSDQESTDTYWAGVRWVTITSNHLLFVTAARENFVEAQIVPRRAFADQIQFDRFLEAVRRNYPGEIFDER